MESRNHLLFVFQGILGLRETAEPSFVLVCSIIFFLLHHFIVDGASFPSLLHGQHAGRDGNPELDWRIGPNQIGERAAGRFRLSRPRHATPCSLGKACL